MIAFLPHSVLSSSNPFGEGINSIIFLPSLSLPPSFSFLETAGYAFKKRMSEENKRFFIDSNFSSDDNAFTTSPLIVEPGIYRIAAVCPRWLLLSSAIRSGSKFLISYLRYFFMIFSSPSISQKSLLFQSRGFSCFQPIL